MKMSWTLRWGFPLYNDTKYYTERFTSKAESDREIGGVLRNQSIFLLKKLQDLHLNVEKNHFGGGFEFWNSRRICSDSSAFGIEYNLKIASVTPISANRAVSQFDRSIRPTHFGRTGHKYAINAEIRSSSDLGFFHIPIMRFNKFHHSKHRYLEQIQEAYQCSRWHSTRIHSRGFLQMSNTSYICKMPQGNISTAWKALKPSPVSQLLSTLQKSSSPTAISIAYTGNDSHSHLDTWHISALLQWPNT